LRGERHDRRVSASGDTGRAATSRAAHFAMAAARCSAVQSRGRRRASVKKIRHFCRPLSIQAFAERPLAMNAFTDPVFAAYSLAVAVLIATLYGLGFATAKTRADRKAVLNHEDVGVNKGASVVEIEHPDVQRIKRAHLNLIENAVPFFAIGMLYTMTAPSLTFARALFAIFVLVRLFHAFFYLSAKQPWRTLSFVVGALVNVIMLVQVLRTLLPAMF
jgi:microsomal prostaglandin-E synthase 1